jgi:hypothetical protein
MNLFKSTFWSRLAAVILLASLSALSGCAANPGNSLTANASNSQKLVAHAFSFDGWNDKWAQKVDLLAYSYGDQYRMVQREVKYGEQTLGYSSGVNGGMPVGEFLYVKWRIKETGEEIENKVDLRGRLPANMFDHQVTYVIEGKQLYVYLVTPQAKKTDSPPILKTYLSRYTVSYEIYPNNTYKK